MIGEGRSQAALAQRLRELRTQWPGVVVTQRQLADALNVSVPLISSFPINVSGLSPLQQKWVFEAGTWRKDGYQ